MIRLFEPVPVKGRASFKPAAKNRVRHFHFGFGPSVADPAGMIKIMETSSERDSEGNPFAQIVWTGWRAAFIVWLIEKLLPVRFDPPAGWNAARRK